MFLWGVAVLPTSLGTQGGPGHIQSVFVLGLSSFGVAAPQTATGLGCIALRLVSKEKRCSGLHGSLGAVSRRKPRAAATAGWLQDDSGSARFAPLPARPSKQSAG